MRDRLVEILHEMPKEMMIGECADYLIANGVVVPPCKVGDMVYFVLDDDETEEGKFISKQKINDVSTRGVFVSDSLTEENCGCFVPFSDFGESAFYTEEKAERALKNS